jgi:NADPH2:quinone reductase
MQQISFTKIGGPDVLATHDVPMPEPGEHDVIIKVAYAGVNNFDVMARSKGYRIELPYAPGLEVSGWVHSTGSLVTTCKVGDAVTAYTGGGGYAEYVKAKDILTFKLHRPEGEIDLKTAAAIPMIVPTAYDMLANVARLRADDTVLIHGAAGGVGMVAGQIAKHLGAKLVMGTVGNDSKVSYALKKGHYDKVFLRSDYEQEIEALLGPSGVSVILDPSGKSFSQLLAPFGMVVVYGNASGELTTPITAGALLAGNQSVAGYSITNLIANHPEHYRTTMETVLNLVALKKVAIDVDAEYTLDSAAEAHTAIENGSNMGKALLKVAT